MSKFCPKLGKTNCTQGHCETTPSSQPPPQDHQAVRKEPGKQNRKLERGDKRRKWQEEKQGRNGGKRGRDRRYTDKHDRGSEKRRKKERDKRNQKNHTVAALVAIRDPADDRQVTVKPAPLSIRNVVYYFDFFINACNRRIQVFKLNDVNPRAPTNHTCESYVICINVWASITILFT